MASQKKKDDITVEAEFTVTSAEGCTVVRRFDGAWTEAKSRSLPVLIHFRKFVRIDAK